MMQSSDISTKKMKDEMKEFKEDSARFSKVRRMTNKEQQRFEFEQMADRKASKAIQITFLNNASTQLSIARQNERAPSLGKQISQLNLNENYFLTSQRIKTTPAMTALVEETKIASVDEKSVYHSYKENFNNGRSNSNPDVEQQY